MRIIDKGPSGYGNPDSRLSYQKSAEAGEFPEGLLERAEEILRSGECLVSVTEHDDGCMDGRFATNVVYYDTAGELDSHTIDPDEHHERPKLAGAGYMTALVAWQSAYGVGESLDSDLDMVIHRLNEKKVYCGSHTGSHASHDTGKTDCGGNDSIRAIQQSGIGQWDDVRAETLDDLSAGGMQPDETAPAAARDSWTAIVANDSYFAGSTGESRLEVIERGIHDAQEEIHPDKPLAVVKALAGDHMERFVDKNWVKGKTFSQREFRRMLHEAFPDVGPDMLPQVFAIDLWRAQELVEVLFDDPSDREVGLAGAVAYQNAALAVLTDGSNPRYMTT